MDLNKKRHANMENTSQYSYFNNGDSLETILIDDEVESLENSNKEAEEILMNLKEMEQKVATNHRRLQFIFALNQVIEEKRESMALITEEDLFSIPNLNLEYVFELYEKQHRNSEYFQRCQQTAKELVAFIDKLTEEKEEGLENKDHIILIDSQNNGVNRSPQSSCSQDEEDDNDASFDQLLKSKQQLRKNKLTKKQILLVQLSSQAKKVTKKIAKKLPVFSQYKPHKRSMPKLNQEELQKRVSYMQIKISEQKQQPSNRKATLSEYYHSKRDTQQNYVVKSIPAINQANEESTPSYYEIHTSIPKSMSYDSTTCCSQSQEDIQNQSQSSCKNQYFSFESLSEYPNNHESQMHLENNNQFNISRDIYHHGQNFCDVLNQTGNINSIHHEATSFMSVDDDQISSLDYYFQQYKNCYDTEEHRENMFHNDGLSF